jgi:hypothetical protein
MPGPRYEVQMKDIRDISDARVIKQELHNYRFREVKNMDEISDPTIWTKRVSPSFPAIIAHPRYGGGCRIVAVRNQRSAIGQVDHIYYLIQFVNPFPQAVTSSKTLDMNAFYDVPRTLDLPGNLIYELVRPMKRLVTGFQYNPTYPSNSLVRIDIAPDLNSYNGYSSTSMYQRGEMLKLSEFQSNVENDDGTLGYRQAMECLIQDYPRAVQAYSMDRLYGLTVSQRGTSGLSSPANNERFLTDTDTINSKVDASTLPSESMSVSPTSKSPTTTGDKVAGSFFTSSHGPPLCDQPPPTKETGKRSVDGSNASTSAITASHLTDQPSYKGGALRSTFPPWYKQLCQLPIIEYQHIKDHWSSRGPPRISQMITPLNTSTHIERMYSAVDKCLIKRGKQKCLK